MPKRMLRQVAAPPPVPYVQLNAAQIARLHTEVHELLFSDTVNGDNAYTRTIELLRADPTAKHTAEMLGKCLSILGGLRSEKTIGMISNLRLHCISGSQNETRCATVLGRIQIERNRALELIAEQK